MAYEDDGLTSLHMPFHFDISPFCIYAEMFCWLIEQTLELLEYLFLD